MSRAAIVAQGLGKRYSIRPREPYRTLRDTLAGALRRRPPHPGPGAPDGVIWALEDATFEIREGEVVGVIGRNGAGKSTLLKLLARITRPSTGSATTLGRVGSLLEVGTGFHPELTGRENVYLNGAILGMTRARIARTFDAIVDFAGLAAFVDTPVKHYSSGMYVRLAFAVAAHLEPDILLVDEVLAVGDLEFQRRCLGKMGEVSRSGRTVLLVSHQLNQIRRMCGRCLWLDGGRVRAMGPAGEVIAAYETDALGSPAGAPPGGRCFVRWSIGGDGHVLRQTDEPFELRFALRLDRPVSLGHFGVAIINDAGAVIAGWGFDRLSLPAGDVDVSVVPRELPIRAGAYAMTVSLFDGGNNLTGGRLLETWHAHPPLTVDSPPVAHPQDEWAGVLNVPAELSVAAVAARA